MNFDFKQYRKYSQIFIGKQGLGLTGLGEERKRFRNITGKEPPCREQSREPPTPKSKPLGEVPIVLKPLHPSCCCSSNHPKCNGADGFLPLRSLAESQLPSSAHNPDQPPQNNVLRTGALWVSHPNLHCSLNRS